MVQTRNLPPQAECDCHLGPDLALKEHPGQGHNDLAFRSEIRAVEQGHHAFIDRDHSDADITYWSIVSNCRHSRTYSVTVQHRPGATLPSSGTCNCESGRYRSSTYPVPCKHVALALRSAERRGLLVWREGVWWHQSAWDERVRRMEHSWIDEHPEDPFEDLETKTMEDFQ